MSSGPLFGLFCNPESRRVDGFSTATKKNLRQRPRLIPWLALLRESDWESRLSARPRFLRLESPGRNWLVEKELLLRGSLLKDEESSRHWQRLTPEETSRLENDPGRIHPQRQWFLGWRDTLRGLSIWARKNKLGRSWLCPPEDVICMFDKNACQKRIESFQLPAPPSLGMPRNFDELWSLMKESRQRRIFLKPCHGSSASGVVALEVSGHRIQAFSTVDLVGDSKNTQLYNRRKILVRQGAADVRKLVDAVCPERCLAQAWIPKAGLAGKTFDLRVMVIAGRVRHIMLRFGNGPITNSQLLGGKGCPEILRGKMGSTAWEKLLACCEQCMTLCFPRSLYAGLDVLVEPNFRRIHIAEVNAFGDLLPGILHQGRDTYDWEVCQALQLDRPTQVSATGA